MIVVETDPVAGVAETVEVVPLPVVKDSVPATGSGVAVVVVYAVFNDR